MGVPISKCFKSFPDVLVSKGIIPGIKVDRGVQDHHGFKGEVITQGLDDLDARFKEYYDLGARFAKWRMVVTIDEDKTPTYLLSFDSGDHLEQAFGHFNCLNRSASGNGFGMSVLSCCDTNWSDLQPLNPTLG